MPNAIIRSIGRSVAVIALAGGALAGCGDAPANSDENSLDGSSQEVLAGSMSELFAQTLEESELSDFEREVLERAAEEGAISQADYDESFNRYQRCISDLGYEETWEKLPNGLYQVTPPPLESQEEVDRYAEQATECADGTVMTIEALFNQQQTNPELLADPRAVAVQCLLEGGFVSAEYTVDDFEADMENPGNASFDVSDDTANACLSSAGYSVAVG